MERVDYETIVIQDIINLEKNGELDLAPWYQRRSVWTPPQKAYLVNSLLENKPVPTVYVRHYLDVEKDKSIKEVVDGQQRLRAVLEYVKDGFAARHPAHSRRVKYSQLTPPQQNGFKMTKVSVGFLLGSDDPDVIEIFGRLNSVSKTLNAQEKRNARFSGEMKQFCLKQAAARVALWRDLQIFTANDVARMLEVQFVSDLVYNLLNGLSDFSNTRLNGLYATNDETFKESDSIAARLDTVFSLIAALPPRFIKDTVFSRQPIFFSLFLVIDAIGSKAARGRLPDVITKVDSMFNAEITPDHRPRADLQFIDACTASTQRIKTRKIRDKYLKKAFTA